MTTSSVRTVTPARSQSFLSLATLKLYLSDASSDNDALYSRLIKDASSAMIQFIGVSPFRQQYEERAYGSGSSRRYLSRIPVEPGTVTTSLDGVTLTEGTTDEGFVLEDAISGLVFRPIGWRWSLSYLSQLNVVDTYYAGFLAPDLITDWSAAHVFTVGLWARPLAPNLLRFECTTAGTSGSTEPVWPSVIGATIADGSVTWTARQATELPDFASQWCYAEVLRLLSDLDWKPGLISRTVEGVSESRFARKIDDGALAPTVISGLTSWRAELGVVGVA